MSEDSLKVFTSKLMDWQREGYYVLLNNFYNMKGKSDKYAGFVVSAVEAEQKFVFKLYDIDKTLDEKHYPFSEVNELVARMDKIIRG